MTTTALKNISCTTIEDMRQRGLRLGFRCDHCSRFRYMADRRFEAETVVSAISESLTCARCGSTEIETFAVARHEASGYWPAESS
ncbi:hypothetical protein [Roseibium sp.]|uniref:hypothetical protein n=1 Tax=Roseibium sp. TaxID=1936156 RepID=UPI003A96F665